MWEYKGTDYKNDFIRHWGMKKGAKADDHKYFMRVQAKNPTEHHQWDYFYTREEYQAYLNGKQNQRPENLMPKQPTNSIRPNITIRKPDNMPNTRRPVNSIQPNITIRKPDNMPNTRRPANPIRPNTSMVDNVNEKIHANRQIANRQRSEASVRDRAEINRLRKEGRQEGISTNINTSDRTDIDRMKHQPTNSSIRKSPEETASYVKSLTHTDGKSLENAEKNAKQIYQDAQKNTLSTIKKSEYSLSSDEDAAMVNPYFSKKIVNKDTLETKGNAYTDNTTSCSMAYEMRRRGYDVEAAPGNGPEEGVQKQIENCFDGAKFSSFKDSKGYIDEMAKGGPGSRGTLCVAWDGGGEEAISYEVNKDGSVDIINTQDNTRCKAKDYYWDMVEFDKTSVVRTDNLKLNDNASKKVINKENKNKNANRNNPDDTNTNVDSNRMDYYDDKDGRRHYYQYKNGVRYIREPGTNKWKKG